jgi:hypothetical protein
MPPYFGGFDYVDAGLLGPTSVYVDVVSAYTDKYYQLYAGRTLIGVTASVAASRIVGQLNLAGGAPAPLTVVAVEAVDLTTDFGALIPDWPSDRFELDWSTSYGDASDVDHFLITRSDAAGLVNDPNNVVGQVNYSGDGDYHFDVPPLPTCGAWQLAVIPVDNAKPTGNPGTASVLTVEATVPPNDLVPDDQGNAFKVADSGGTLSVTFNYPS